MRKIANFIVDKRRIILILFIGLCVYSVYGMTKVKVEYDISSYLPEETDTRKAITIMDEEFTTHPSTTILIRNISYEKAASLYETIKEFDDVKSFTFKNTEDYYKESTAKFSITFEGDDSTAVYPIYQKILETLNGYDLYIESSISDGSSDLLSEINFVLLLALIVIVLVIMFTSESFLDIVTFLITFGVAALLNMGTNYWLGTISYISNTVCVILQLALAIDYAIILSHRFTEEKDKGLEASEALKEALSKAIVEISGSSLTTIAGLLALTTMALRLGEDMGIVLAKSIICSMVTVFLLMPALLMMFNNITEKTKHKNFVPAIPFVGKFVVKMRYVIIVLFVLIVSAGTVLSFKTDYVYAINSIDTSKPTMAQKAQALDQEIFGESTAFVILVPGHDYVEQKNILDFVSQYDLIDTSLGLSNQKITYNNTSYYLTEQINYKQFSKLLGLDESAGDGVFTAYAYFKMQDTKDSLDEVALYEVNKTLYTASLLELIDCAISHDDFIRAYLYNSDTLTSYDDLKNTIEDAEDQLRGENYSRLVFTISSTVESDETFALIKRMISEVKELYPNVIFAGDSMSAYDLNESFSSDNLKVSLFTILFVFIILMFAFNSWGVPILLTLTIQGAIFINFSYYVLRQSNLYFFVYLMISAIQMGATIDYAIVITNRFRDLKTTLGKKEAIIQAISDSFATILTSGLIMTASGFLIGAVVTEPLIATMGLCLGRGVIISIICVMFVLPAFLYAFDTPLSHTYFKPIKKGQSLGDQLKKMKNRVIVVTKSNNNCEEEHHE